MQILSALWVPLLLLILENALLAKKPIEINANTTTIAFITLPFLFVILHATIVIRFFDKVNQGIILKLAEPLRRIHLLYR